MSPAEAVGSGGLRHLTICLLSLCSLDVGRCKSHVWPLVAQGEMSGSHRVLGTCRLSSGALPLRLSGVETPGGPVSLFRALWLALVALSSL